MQSMVLIYDDDDPIFGALHERKRKQLSTCHKILRFSCTDVSTDSSPVLSLCFSYYSTTKLLQVEENEVTVILTKGSLIFCTTGYSVTLWFVRRVLAPDSGFIFMKRLERLSSFNTTELCESPVVA